MRLDDGSDLVILSNFPFFTLYLAYCLPAQVAV